MRKRKKRVFAIAVLVVVLGIGWYLFLGSRITGIGIWEQSTLSYITEGTDEYYGSEPTQEAYDTLYDLYEQHGLAVFSLNRSCSE